MIIFDIVNIIFDLINSLFKCCSRFDFFYFNYDLHNKRNKIIVKGCSNFINRVLWWNLDWYLIDNFSSFWEARCFWYDINQFFFNIFWLLVLLFYDICHYSSGCSKIWLDLSNLAYSLVSRQSSEDEVSEVRVINSFLICAGEKVFGSTCFSPLNSINFLLVFQSFDQMEKYWLGIRNPTWLGTGKKGIK